MDRSLDAAIVTKDADRLLRFYRDVLGLEQTGQVRVSGVLPDGTLTRLRAGSSVLKILQFDTDPTETAPSGPVASATGMRYVTIGVDDIGATIDACRAAGHQVVLPITELRPGISIAFVRDPDGGFVELVVGA
jgi:catechol 2,3-dioxygenase-like lactoylglutathione lyase family enzyme